MMKRALLSLFLLSLCVMITAVNTGKANYTNGYYENGYTYRDGYWWDGDYAYTRSKVYSTSYQQVYNGYGGYYYTPYTTYYWSYTKVPVVTKYVDKPYEAPKPTDPDWKTKLLDLAKQRDQFEGQIRKDSFDQAAYLESIKALGLEGNFNWKGYGTAPPYIVGNRTLGSVGGYGSNSYGSYNLGNYGANASTIYGYSYSSIKDLYGDTNLNTLYQQSARLTQNAQTLAGQANTEFSSLVAQEGGNRARVAEILAKAQAAKMALDAAGAGSSAKVITSTFSLKSGSDSGGSNEIRPAMPPAEQTENNTSTQAFQQLAVERCASCHSSTTKKEGGFDIGLYPAMTAEQKSRVWARLVTDDKDKVMPKGSKKLTPAELRLFINN
jgi:mono/diheme cytochrome c family protein